MKTLRRYRKPVAWLMVMLMASSLPGGQTFGADLYKSSNNIGLNQAPAYSQNLVPTATDTLVFGNQLTAATTFELLTSGTTFVAGTFNIGGLRFMNNMGGGVTFRPSNNLNNTLAVGAGGIDMSEANQNVTFTRTQGSGVLTLNTTAAQDWQVGTGHTLLIGADVSGNQAVTISGKATAKSITPGGTVVLGGNNGATGLGALTVVNSTVQVDYNVAGQNKLNDTALVTLERSNLNITGGASVSDTELIGGLNIKSGLSTITRGSSNVVLNLGPITRDVGGVLSFGAANIATTTNAMANGILGRGYVINNSDWAMKGSGDLVQAYSGYVTTWGTTDNVGLTTNKTNSVNTTINSLKITNGSNVTNGASVKLTIATGGILKNADNTSLITGGTLTAGAASNGSDDELAIWNNQNVMTIDSVIVNNGTDTLHLTKAGGGVLRLIKANTYTGITTIAQGALQLGDGAASGNVGSLGAGVVVNDGTLVVNKTVASTIANNISGLGAFTKEIASTVTLSGTNTYAGETTVKGGSLIAGSVGGFSPNSLNTLQGTAILNLNGFDSSVGALASSSVGTVINLGANTLTIAGNNTSGQTLFGTVSGTGGLVKNGLGVQTLSGGGSLSFTGATVVNAGTLRVLKPMATSAITVNGGTFISGVVGVVPDTTTVNLAGSTATWTISNGITDTIGGLSSTAGSLLNLGTGTTATGVNLTINDNGVVPTIANGVITGVDATLTKNGTNGLTLGGGNSFNGPLTINNGIVTLTVAPATPNLSGVLNDKVDVSIANLATAGLALGSDEAIGSLNGGGALGGNVNLGIKTLATGFSNTNDTFAGKFIGTTGGLRKVGAGTMTLTNNSTYTGLTTVIDGTLNLSAVGGNTLAAGSLMNVNGDHSVLNVNTNQTFGQLTGGYNATIVINGAGVTLTNGAGNPVLPTSLVMAIAGTNTDLVPVASTTNLVVGQLVTGTNIPLGSRIVSILGGNVLQISKTVSTAAPSGTLEFAKTTPTADVATLGTGNLVKLDTTAGLVVGMVVTGTNIPASSTIAAVVDGTTIRLNNNVTLAPTGIINCAFNQNAAASGINTPFIQVPSTAGLSPGMLVSGTNIPVGSIITQILGTTQNPLIRISIPIGGTAPTGTMAITPLLPLSATLTGAGNYTFAGTSLVATQQIQTKATYTGDTVVSGGTLILGGDRLQSNVLPSNSNLNLASINSAVTVISGGAQNFRSYQAVGGLTGTGAFNLVNNSNSGALVVGMGNASSAFDGNIAGSAVTDTALMKVGTGTFTWTNAAGNVHDGLIRIDDGSLVVAGAGGLDANNIVVLSNKTGATYSTLTSDTVKSLSGGARVTGFLPNSLAGTVDTNSIGGNSLVIGGAGDLGGVVNIGTGATLTLNVGAGTRQYGGSITGLGAFTKAGAFTQELLGNVSTAGLVSVTAGTLRLAVYGAATGVGNVGVGGQGTLASTTNLAATGIFDFNGATQTLNSLTAVTGGSILLGNGNLTINTLSGTSGSLASVISGTGNVTVNATLGASGWTLGGANTFTGLLNINGGIVTDNNANGIANTARVNVGAGATFVVALADTIGGLSGAGAITLTNNLTLLESRNGTFSGTSTGAGQLLLDGVGSLRITSNQGYTGITTVARGSILSLDYGNGATNIVPGVLTLSGGTIQMVGNGTADVATSTTLSTTATATAVGGGNTIRNFDGSRLGLGAITRNAGSTLNVMAGGAATTTLNVNGILGGYAVADGSSWAVSGILNTVAITGLATGSYTANSWGTDTVNSDVISSFGGATGSVNSLRFNTAAANTVTLSGNSIVVSGGVLVTPLVGANDSSITTAGGFTLTGTAASGGVAGNELILHNYNQLGNLRVDVPIANNGANATRLTTAGLGRTILLRDNTFTGLTTISDGVLQVGNGGTTGNLGTGLVAGASIVNDGVLVFNRGNLAASLDITTNQLITGRGWLRQEGLGTIRLSAANTYTGRTTVAAGKLEVNNSSALGAVAGITTLTSVLGSATLDLANTIVSTMTITDSIELNGGTLRDSSGLTTGFNALTGAIYLTANSFVNVTTVGDVLRTTGTVFGVPDQSSAAGSQPAGLTLNGLGILRLEGNAFYTGSTTVNTGANLTIGSAGAVGNVGSGPIIANGTVIMNRNDAVKTVLNTLTGNGIFQKDLNTSTFLVGDLSGFTGTYQVNNGSLYFGSDGFLPTNTLGGKKTVTNTAGTDAFIRHNYQNDLVVDSGIYTLTANATSNRSRLVKEGIGTLELTGLVKGDNTGRSTIDVVDGVLRLSGGISDVATGVGAFTGDINITNTGRNYNIANSYLEFSGSNNINFGGHLIAASGAVIMNSTGTLTFSQIAGAVQTNNDTRGLLGYKGTIVFNATGTGGDAWRDADGFIALAGSQLNVNSNESVGMLGSLPMSTMTIASGMTLTLLGNNNANNRSGIIAGKITGLGNLVASGSGNFGKTLYLPNETSDFAPGGDFAIPYSQVQATSITNKGLPSSIGAGNRIVLNPASGDSQFASIAYVGQNAAGQSTDRDWLLDGASTTMARAITANGAGPLTITGTVMGSAGAVARNFFIDGNSTKLNTLSGVISDGAGAAALSLVKRGTGLWSLTGINTFTGSTQIQDGILRINSFAAVNGSNTAAALRIGNGGTGGTFEYAGVGETTAKAIDFSATTGSPRFVNLGTGPLNLNGTLTFGAGAKTILLGRYGDTPGILSTFSAPFVDNAGATTVQKEGQSSYFLSNPANTFTGNINLTEGSLRIASPITGQRNLLINNSFGRGALLVLDADASFNFFGHSDTGTGAVIAGLGTLANPNEIRLTGGHTFTVIGNFQSNGLDTSRNYYSGIITGDGSFIKNGNGNRDQFVRFGQPSQFTPNSGLNTFTGSLTLNSGRIDVNVFADGGQASGIGAGTAANTGLILNGDSIDDGLRFVGVTARTTNRLLSLGAAPTDLAQTNPDGIWADGTRIGGMEESTIKFTGTGAMGFVGSGNRVLTLRGGNIGDNEFNMAIGDGAGGVTSLNKIEGGTWVLGGNNSFTGAVTVSSGILSVTHSNALGTSTGGVNINGGGGTILELQGSLAITGESLTFGATDAGLASSIGANSWSGNVAVNNNARFLPTAGSTITLSGVMTTDGDGATLQKFDAGTLVFAGNNVGMTNANNDTTIGGGKLVLDYSAGGNAGLSKLADAGDLSFGGTGNFSAVNISGSNSGVLRQVYQTGGTLELAGGAHVESVNTFNVFTGQSSIIRSSGSSVINLNSISTRGFGGVLDFAEAGIARTDNNNTNNILGGWATINHTTWAQSILSSAADTPITAFISFTNNNYTSANANVDATLLADSPINFAANVNSLRFNTATGSTLTLAAGQNKILSGGILITPNVTSDFTPFTGDGELTAGSTNSTADFMIHNWSGRTVTIDVPIEDNGTGSTGLSVSGNGTIILTKNSGYAAQTNINGGTLQIGTGGTTGSMGNGQGLVVNNGSLIFNANRVFTQTGQIIGNGGITMNMGDITLSGGNNFHGDFVMNGGVLTLTNGSGLGSTIGKTTLNTGTKLYLQNATSGEYIIINEGVTIGETIQGNSNFAGRLDFNNTTTAGAIIEVINDASGTALTLGGIVRSGNGFTKTGDGALRINQTNWVNGAPTLMGQVNITAGTLWAENGRALGGTGAGNETIIANGASIDLRGNDFAFGDDPTLSREIFRIAGTGVGNVGALRSTNQNNSRINALQLSGDATIGGGGSMLQSFSDGSGLREFRRDGFASNDQNNTGDILRVRLVPADRDPTSGFNDNLGTSLTSFGGTYALTKIGVVSYEFRDTTITNLSAIKVNEGELRLIDELSNTSFAAPAIDPYVLNNAQGATRSVLNAADVGAVQVVYTGPTPSLRGIQASATLAVDGAILNPNTGARLVLFRQHLTQHTTPVTAFGSSGALGNIDNNSSIELNDVFTTGGITTVNNGITSVATGATYQGSTIPYTWTRLGGKITLTGMTSGANTFFNVEGSGFATTNQDAILGNRTPAGGFFVNPASILVVSGDGTTPAITGTGGFTKLGIRELRLTGATNFTGDTVITRSTNAAVSVDPSQPGSRADFAGGVTLYGVGAGTVGGTLGSTANIILDRQGLLRVDNTNDLDTSSFGVLGGNNNNRINDSANIIYKNGIIIFDNEAANAETIGAVQVQRGNNYLAFNLASGAGNTTLTAASITRSPGAVLAISDWNVGSTFANSTAGDSLKIVLDDSGASLGLVGTGTAPNTTDLGVAPGIFGGKLPLSQAMTTESRPDDNINQFRQNFFASGREFMTVEGNVLRPLDNDEYASTLIAGQNVNLSALHTSLLTNTTINSLRLGNLGDYDAAPAVAGTSMANIQATPVELTLGDVTLGISSGMILSAPFGVAQRNNLPTFINGGTIDAGSKELILHNVNLSYRLQDGIYEGFTMEVRSALAGTGGLTKSGAQQITLEGRNTYSGATSVIEGNLKLQNSMALGAGRSLAGATGLNGTVIEASGSLNFDTGINIGSAIGVANLDNHYEDIAIRTLNSEQRAIIRSEGQVNRLNGDIVADMVDGSGQTLFGDNRVAVAANSTLILTGDIYGGSSRVSNDEYITDARILTTNGSGAGNILFKGQFGDRSNGLGGATTIAFNPSLFASDGATRTHQNETMRLWIGGNVELNFNTYQPWNAVGRLEMTGGYLRYMGDGNFYTTDAANKINSVLGAELLPMVGFNLGIGTIQSNTGVAPVGDMAAILLTKPGQTFNLSNFIVGNTGGAALIGGENESGVVTFGDGQGSVLLTRTVRLFASAGGRVDINSRLLGGAIDKGGRGEVVNSGSPLGAGTSGSINIQGGTLRLDYGTNNNARFASSGNLSFGGGTLILESFSGLVLANTTQGAAQRGDAGSSFNVNNGGSELIVAGRGGNVMTLNIGTGPIGTTNLNSTSVTRAAGGTINFVEMDDALPGSAGVITLIARTGLVQNVTIPYATYGTAPRTATDFAMSDDTTDGIGPYLRVSDEYKNDITSWLTNEDISEKGGAGFVGILVPKTVAIDPMVYINGNTHHRVISTLRFDANAESAITIGADDKLIVGNGGIMTTTAVGTSNKTIAGGTSTTVYTTGAASTTAGSNSITGINTTGFYAGMRVTGPFIPTGAYVTQVTNATSIEISTKATGTDPASNLTVTKEGGLTSTVYSTAEGTTTNGSATIGGLDTTDLFPGLRISGTNIPAGSFITAVNSPTSVTINNNATLDENAVAIISFGAAELVFHHYAQGALNIASPIVGTNAVVITGPSVTDAATLAAWNGSPTNQVVFTGNNTYTGKTYIGGSILSIDSLVRLGASPVVATAGQLYINGGALRWTGGNEQLGANRQTQIGGNGAVFDVVNGDSVLSLNAVIASETSGSNFAVGDIIKMGAGVLDLGVDNPNFNGLIDVRQGTLRVSSTTTGTSTVFGTNRSAIDGTTMRNGTRLELWNNGAAADYAWEEWFKFEGNNTVQFGQPGVSPQRTPNMNGVIDLQGPVTMDVTQGVTARLNNAGGYLTGPGSISKIGQGVLEFRDNNVEWSGQLKIQEGGVLLASNGRPGGMSTLPIVLGGTEYQGFAELRVQNENALPGSYLEVFQNIDVAYNPLQTKRLQVLNPQHNGQDHYFYGNITMGDNLIVHTSDSQLVSGGKFDFVHFKGNFVDAATTSGNLLFHTDETNNAAANNQTNGGVWGYNVLSGDNSGWSGDVTVGSNTAYDRDEITILRLDNNNALTAKNDVTLNGSSVLQAGGRTVTIGGLSTPGAIGEAGNSNFTGAIIENAATTPGTLTITQTTPGNTEVIMSATIRDGLPPDHMYQTNGQAGAALNIIKDGPGWTTLTQDNQQTGTIVIKAGTLQVGVNGFGDTGATNAAGLTVKSTGVLAGTGIVYGPTTVELGATVKPGDVAGSVMGTLVMNGDAEFQAGSTLALDVSKPTFNAPELNSTLQANYAAIIAGIPTTYAGTLSSPVLTNQHDHLDINGLATFAPGSKISVSFFGGYTPVAGDIFNLIDWMNVAFTAFNVGTDTRLGGEVGTDLDLPVLTSNLVYVTSLLKSDGILAITYAPEPSRALLLGLGLFGLLLRRRRR